MSQTDRSNAPLLMWSLLRSFIWLDRALQSNMAARGWTPVSRAESQVMLLASAGITRPTEISKALGLSRQAINQTIKQLAGRQLVTLVEDPEDRRCKIIEFADAGQAVRSDALEIIAGLDAYLADRLGAGELDRLKTTVNQDWGEPPLLSKRKLATAGRR